MWHKFAINNPIRHFSCSAVATVALLFAAASSKTALAHAGVPAPDSSAQIDADTKVIESKDSTAHDLCEARRDRAQIYGKLGQTDKALADLDSVLAIKDLPNDDAASAVSDRAQIYLAGKEYAKAAADYGRMMELMPDWFQAGLSARGNCYVQWGKMDLALADYDAIMAKPGISKITIMTAINGRGDCYGHFGLPDKAIDEYTRVIVRPEQDSDPEMLAQSLVARGDSYQSEYDYDHAIADYTKALAIGREVAWALASRSGAYYNKGEYEKGVADANRMVAFNSEPSLLGFVLNGRGAIRVDQREYALAIADFTSVIEWKDVSPSDLSIALNWRGYCFRQTGKFEKAIADYTRAIELKDSPDAEVFNARLGRAICFEIAKDQDKARTDYAADIAATTKIINTPDTLPDAMTDALVYRGYTEYFSGSLDKALEDTRGVLKIQPRNFLAFFNIGLILIRQGKFDEAKKSYETGMALRSPLGAGGAEDDLIDLRNVYQGPPETSAFLGWIYISANKSELGAAELKKYLADHADGPLASWAKELLAAPSPK